MENFDLEYLLNQIGALNWVAAMAKVRNDVVKCDRCLDEANRCKAEVLRRYPPAQPTDLAPWELAHG